MTTTEARAGALAGDRTSATARISTACERSPSILVVAFHAGLGRFRGGFIGVDIFFVLSGYLVTSILLRDLTATGTMNWRRFYSRRVRRILPAALVTLRRDRVGFAVGRDAAGSFDALGGFRSRVPLRRQLVLHPSVDSTTSRPT